MKAPDVFLAGPVMAAAVPIVGLAVNIGSQWVLCRLPLPIGHVRREFISFGCGVLFSGVCLQTLLSGSGFDLIDRAGYLGLNLLSYTFLGFCFFNAINLNISSLRIRMLKEYHRQYPTPLTDAELIAKYNVRSMLEVRLARLESGRQLYQAHGRFFVRKGAVTVIGYFFAGLRRFLLGN